MRSIVLALIINQLIHQHELITQRICLGKVCYIEESVKFVFFVKGMRTLAFILRVLSGLKMILIPERGGEAEE